MTFTLPEEDLRELQRIRRAIEGAPDIGKDLYLRSSDPEIQKYVDAMLTLRKAGAFNVTVPQPGACAVIENTVALRVFDKLTERKLRDMQFPIVNLLGFNWARLPVLLGPREVVAPRAHARQQDVISRVYTYYRLKKRAAKHIEMIEEYLDSGLVPCSHQQSWHDYGAAILLPRTAVSHDEYRNPKWWLLQEADREVITLPKH